MLETRGSAKSAGKDRIQIIESEVRDALGGVGAPRGSVDWRIAFAEVFAARGGFDVVIANPPYVRQEQIGPLKADLTKLFPSVYQGTADILVYFYARAIQLMRPGGWLAFITSNKYMRAAYGKKLRAFLRNSLTMSQVMDFGDLPVFAATSYPAVLVGRKGNAGDDHRLRIADLTTPVRAALGARKLSVTPETVNRVMDGLSGLLDRHGHANYPQKLLRPGGWILEDPAVIRLFERLMNQGTPLGEFVEGRIYYGIKTGLNDAFVIDRYKRDELIDADSKSAEIIEPWLRGKDIKRWTAEWAQRYIVFARRGIDIDAYPAIRGHLERFRHPTFNANGKLLMKGLEPRGGTQWRKRGAYQWYELQDTIAYYEEFERPKIIWGNLAVESKFARDLTGAYISAPANFLIEPALWLIAVMNSSLLNFFYPRLTVTRSGSFQEFKIGYIEPTPIITPAPALQRRLDSIAQAGIAGEPVDTDELNDIVNHLYNLSPADVALINDWFQRRSLAT